MMDAALIIKGVVDTMARNVFSLDDLPSVTGGKWVEVAAGQVFGGWLYDGETFTAPAAPPEPMPDAVTMRQARIALSRAGVLKQAQEAIAAMAGQSGEEARIEWEFATSLRRDHPLVAGLGQSLGLSDVAIDDLFRQAALI